MEQQDKYQMIIHTKGGLISHVAVEIKGPVSMVTNALFADLHPKKDTRSKLG